MAYTAIDDPSAHFQADTYTGGQTITFDGNSDLQPDWIWIKARTTAENWRAFDTSRGVGNGTDETKGLVISQAGTEESYSIVTSMDSDGVTLNTGDAYLNSGSHTYLLSAWKANGGSTTTNDASATGVGNLDSVYQANTTAGFSIVTFDLTGDSGDKTIAHGLGQAPDVIIFKNRDDARNWAIHHHTQTPPEYMVFDTDAVASSDNFNNSTDPTSTVFSLETAWHGAHKHVAYCFAEIQGYSKFGSYTGNGNADGTFVYTGFKPAWLLLKQSSSSGEHWRLLDSARSTYNIVNKHLAPSIAGTESAETGCDFLSNGFKLRDGDTHQNADDETYIYMAFAEQPFVTSGGVPCTAR